MALPARCLKIDARLRSEPSRLLAEPVASPRPELHVELARPEPKHLTAKMCAALAGPADLRLRQQLQLDGRVHPMCEPVVDREQVAPE